MPNTTDFIIRFKGDKKDLELIEDVLTGKHPVLKMKAPCYSSEFGKNDILVVKGFSNYYMSHSTTDQPVSGAFQSFSRKDEKVVTPNFGWAIYSSLMFRIKDLDETNKTNLFDQFKKENRNDLIWALEEEPSTKKDPLLIVKNQEVKEVIQKILDGGRWVKGSENILNTFNFRKYVLEHGFVNPHDINNIFGGQGSLYVNLQSLCWALNVHAELHGFEPGNSFEEFETIYPDKFGEHFHETVCPDENGEYKESALFKKFTI